MMNLLIHSWKMGGQISHMLIQVPGNLRPIDLFELFNIVQITPCLYLLVYSKYIFFKKKNCYANGIVVLPHFSCTMTFAFFVWN